jgi:hypothetical protein
MSADGGHPDDPDAHPGQGSRTDRRVKAIDVVLRVEIAQTNPSVELLEVLDGNWRDFDTRLRKFSATPISANWDV